MTIAIADLNNYNWPVPFSTTWQIVDSTKLNTYAECPRKYFYEYVLGWRKPSHDLVFGKIYHEALEKLYTLGLTAENALLAAEYFNDRWLEHYPNLDIEQLERFRPKTPDNTVRSLLAYVSRYSGIWHRFIELEIGGLAHISTDPERMMAFKLDWLGEHEHYGKCILEHKTSGQSLTDRWAKQFALRLQIGTYNHAGRCFVGDDFFGVVVNGIGICNAPRTKKDGTLYANARDIEFRQVACNRSNLSMNTWLFTVNHLWDELEEDFTNLVSCSADDTSLECFRQNPNACGAYRGCPYWQLCCSCHNPLQRVNQLPEFFEVDHWNPLNEIKHFKGEIG